MKTIQPGVLAPVPPAARYLNFSLKHRANLRKALGALAALADGESCVAGIGESVLRALGIAVPGMRSFPSYAGAGFEVPSTPVALWCWLRGSDRGAILHQGRALEAAIGPAFSLDHAIDGLRYGKGRG